MLPYFGGESGWLCTKAFLPRRRVFAVYAPGALLVKALFHHLNCLTTYHHLTAMALNNLTALSSDDDDDLLEYCGFDDCRSTDDDADLEDEERQCIA